MKVKHNKKRNAGLVFEQLVQYMSEKLLENDKEAAKRCLDIINDAFSAKSELYKERRLCEALMGVKFDSDSLVQRVLSESKQYCQTFDHGKLKREKSALIRRINTELSEGKFFDRKVDRYRSYATVQQLMNEWRVRGFTSRDALHLEQALVRMLRDDASRPAPALDENTRKQVSPLVRRVAEKRFHQKHAHLSSAQRECLLAYVTAEAGDSAAKSRYVETVGRIRDRAIGELREFLASDEDHSAFFVEQSTRALKMMEAYEPREFGAELAERGAQMIRLIEEVKSE